MFSFQIPRGNYNVPNNPATVADGRSNKFCGRFLNPNPYQETDAHVCSKYLFSAQWVLGQISKISKALLLGDQIGYLRNERFF